MNNAHAFDDIYPSLPPISFQELKDIFERANSEGPDNVKAQEEFIDRAAAWNTIQDWIEIITDKNKRFGSWGSLKEKVGISHKHTSFVLDHCHSDEIKTSFPGLLPGLQEKASAGDTTSLLHLSNALLNGKGVEKDPGNAIQLMKQAAVLGSSVARLKLFWTYCTGNYGFKDYALGLNYLEEAVAQENPAAYSYMAWHLWHGFDGFPQNIGRALELYRKAAQQGFGENSYEFLRNLFKIDPTSLVEDGEPGECLNELEMTIAKVISSHQLMLGKNNEKSDFIESKVALPQLFDWFSEIQENELKISHLIEGLKKAKAGFMVTCLQSDKFHPESLKRRDNAKGFNCDEGTFTFSEENVALLLQVKAINEGTENPLDNAIQGLVKYKFLLENYPLVKLLGLQEEGDPILFEEAQQKLEPRQAKLKPRIDTVTEEIQMLESIKTGFKEAISRGTARRNRVFMEEYSFLKKKK